MSNVFCSCVIIFLIHFCFSKPRFFFDPRFALGFCEEFSSCVVCVWAVELESRPSERQMERQLSRRPNKKRRCHTSSQWTVNDTCVFFSTNYNIIVFFYRNYFSFIIFNLDLKAKSTPESSLNSQSDFYNYLSLYIHIYSFPVYRLIFSSFPDNGFFGRGKSYKNGGGPDGQRRHTINYLLGVVSKTRFW